MKKKKAPLEKNYRPSLDCLSYNCDWAVYNSEADSPKLSCVEGKGDCLPFNLLEALPSGFHNEALIDATGEIKRIMENLQHPDGYTLSLVTIRNPYTGERGIMLGWVDHNADLTGKENVVTGEHPPEVVARALGLKDWKSEEK